MEAEKVSKSVRIDLKGKLKHVLPEVFEDNKINFEKLKALLSGEIIEKEDDRFYFNWAGKGGLYKIIQSPAYGTLKPDKERSVDFDRTENIVIVGENLETLKLLLKPYFGKVKMIYIDPPYNTGKDFIYRDNFREPLKDYLEKTGQIDSEGKKLTTNTEASGRYHSDWLNFMYPRLFLARSLLKDDGVIFISIDDNEVHNLRKIMDEIFGEENFITILKIQMRNPERQLSEKAYFQKSIEYMLVYSKNNNEFNIRKEEIKYDFTEYRYKIIEKSKGEKRTIGKKEIFVFKPNEYEIIPCTDINDPHILKSISIRGKIKTAQHSGKFYEKYLRPLLKLDGRDTLYKVMNMGDDAIGFRYIKQPSDKTINGVYYQGIPQKYREDIKDASKTKSWSDFYDFVEDNIRAGEILKEIFGKKVFDTPKPVNLIKWITSISTSGEDVILDFFAGSGTTGHAVWDLNKEDGRNRKFILVQLDEEVLDEGVKREFPTVADICIERLKRASEKYRQENNSQDFGFKVFRLDKSNFNLKDEFEIEEGQDVEKLKKKYLEWLGLWINEPLVQDWQKIDVIYEVLLKEGLNLNSKIEQVKIKADNFYFVRDTEQDLDFYISLEDKIKNETIEEIRTPKYKEKMFVFLDKALTDNDKINLSAFVRLKVI